MRAESAGRRRPRGQAIPAEAQRAVGERAGAEREVVDAALGVHVLARGGGGVKGEGDPSRPRQVTFAWATYSKTPSYT